MKKIIFSLMISSTFLGNLGLAQTTITSLTMPQIGYTYNMLSDTNSVDLQSFSISTGSTSAQTWDYTALFQTIYGEAISYVAPSSGLGYSNFPNADMATLQDTNWIYFDTTANGLNVDGVYTTYQSGTTAIDFSPDLILMPFPYSLNNFTNNVYSSTFIVSAMGIPTQVRHHVTRTIKADAYGCLTTPTDTYQNTLRIKTHESTIDSIFLKFLGNWVFNRKRGHATTTYTWMQDSLDSHLMEIQLQGTNITKAQYLLSFSDGQTTSVNKEASFLVNFFPNPANETLTIENSTLFSELQLTDVSGRIVMKLNPTLEKITIDISGLQNGIYFLTLRNSEHQKFVTKKIAIQH